MKKQNQSRGGLVSAIAVSALLLAAAPARAGGVSSQPEIIPPLPFLYPVLLSSWWQWTLAFPANADPASDTAPQESNQSGPVWFLAGLHGSAQTGAVSVVTRQITVPEGKLLFFPVLTIWTDNSGCPTYTDYTVPELRAEAAGEWSAVTETTCTIDGVAVPGLGNPQTSPYLTDSTVFGYTVASHDNLLAAVFGEPCIPDGTTVFPAVAEGACLLVAPLSPGPHTIHFVGVVGPVASPFVAFDETYNVTVAPGQQCK